MSAGPPSVRTDLPGRERVLAEIEEVLALPELRPSEPGLLARMRDDVLEWIGGVFRDLLSAVGITDGEALTGVVVVMLALGATALAAYAVWTLLPGRRSRERANPADAPPGATVETVPRPADRLRRAAALASEGRHADAMHELYGGVLLWLDARGLARYAEGKTGGEYARELGSAGLARPFRAVLGAFYPVAFGGRAASEGSWRDMRASATSLGVPE